MLCYCSAVWCSWPHGTDARAVPDPCCEALRAYLARLSGPRSVTPVDWSSCAHEKLSEPSYSSAFCFRVGGHSRHEGTPRYTTTPLHCTPVCGNTDNDQPNRSDIPEGGQQATPDEVEALSWSCRDSFAGEEHQITREKPKLGTARRRARETQRKITQKYRLVVSAEGTGESETE